MVPRVGGRNLVRRLNTVVLPAPLGPIKAWTAPSRTERSTLLTATKPLNSLVRPRADNTTGASRLVALAGLGAAATLMMAPAFAPEGGTLVPHASRPLPVSCLSMHRSMPRCGRICRDVAADLSERALAML